MSRFIQILKLAPVLVIAALPQAPVQSPPPFSVWVLSSLERAPSQGSPGGVRSAVLAGARAESVAFQVVLQAPLSGLHHTTVLASDLTGADGETISASNLVFYREYYVEVSPGSPDKGGTNRPLGAGTYPDALIPFIDPQTGAPPSGGDIPAAPFDVLPGTNQPIWIDILVPRDVKPGLYMGTVFAKADEGEIDVPVSLRVWNFELPVQPSLRSILIYWNTPLPGEIVQLLQHRLSPQRVPPGSCPGGNCPSVSSAERALRPNGLAITGTGMFSGADNGNCNMTQAPSTADFSAAAASHDPDLELFNYTADEVTHCPQIFPQIIRWAQNMHRAGIRNLVVMDPNPLLFDDGTGTGRSAVDIWVVLPRSFDSAGDTIAQALAKGDEVWSYNAVSQDTYSPKWLIDYDPINFRIQPGFISESLGLTGILYWRIDRWTPNPWTSVNNSGVFNLSNYPGEGMLIYPGGPAGVVGVAPSIRLKELRDGEQDFEYVEKLKQLGQGDWALQEVRTIASDWHNWTHDPAALAAVRQRLGNRIDSIESAKGH